MEGDLLGARESFERAAALPGGEERGRAWQAKALRESGQPVEAAALLEPLARRFPRDRRVRFELGVTYMAELRSADAAREFEAILAVDPTDYSAHYNLMLCRQRLNQVPEARREEAMYRVLAREEPIQPLRVHALESP
jgi:tetratricopeptide (TPR) repeat protein